MNEFFDEAMVMIAYGFRHMAREGASNEEMQSTALAMVRAISKFSSECLSEDSLDKEAA